MTSSWSSEKLWISSIAAAAPTAAAGSPPRAWLAASTRAGRIAFPDDPVAGAPSGSVQPKW